MTASADNDRLMIADFQISGGQGQSSGWRLVEDGVMGGVSRGSMALMPLDGQNCLRLMGQVSTENNGGFIQLSYSVDSKLAQQFPNYTGIEIKLRGNNESYNIHLKQRGLFLPWQSFRSSIFAKDEWQLLKVPFDSFEPYKTSQTLKLGKINQLALLAIGRDFDADVCIASIYLYR